LAKISSSSLILPHRKVDRRKLLNILKVVLILMRKMSMIIVCHLCKIGSNVPKNQANWISTKAQELKAVAE